MGNKIVITEMVFFVFAKTEILEKSYPVLDAVVSILKEHPEIQKVLVEGHTDTQGSAASNKKLSQGRAKAVMDYLIGHGIEASRLSSKGYGEERPLVKPEKTEEDYQKNRRVEFTILE
jgi:outer membrane protein OmpA-like peptidoglycan-associated protein